MRFTIQSLAALDPATTIGHLHTSSTLIGGIVMRLDNGVPFELEYDVAAAMRLTCGDEDSVLDGVFEAAVQAADSLR